MSCRAGRKYHKNDGNSGVGRTRSRVSARSRSRIGPTDGAAIFRGRHRLIAFAACEIAVALFAIAIPWIYYDWLYVRLGALNWSPAALAALIFLVRS